jgi:pimeloyl-ACP methyl ester carboxylesterase
MDAPVQPVEQELRSRKRVEKVEKEDIQSPGYAKPVVPPAPPVPPSEQIKAPAPSPTTRPERRYQAYSLTSIRNWWWFIPIILGLYFLFPSSTPTVLKEHHGKGKMVTIYDGIENIRLFVRDAGPVDSKEAVVLLHGMSTTSFLYRKVIPRIANSNLRVIAFDWPGHGFSDKSQASPYTWSYFSTVLANLLSVLNVQKVHLVVHDFAGPIGSQYAVLHPEKIASLTFANTFLNAYDFSHPYTTFFSLHGLRHLAYWFSSFEFWNPIRWLWWKWSLSDNIEYDAVKSYYYLSELNHGKAIFFKTLDNFNYTREYTDYIRDGLRNTLANVPFQILWVNRDNIPDSRGQAVYIKQNFPQVRKELWLDSKHLPQEDQPELFSKEIIHFVKEVNSGAFSPEKTSTPG